MIPGSRMSMSVPKAWIKAGLGRLGYTIQRRTPPPASDPRFVLAINFDYVLAHYLASRNDPRPFFFLQVGANDGVMDDPLHQHIRDGNWHGILVEPQSAHFRRLVENYAGLEGLTFVNAAISEQSGPRRMFVIQDETGAPIEDLGRLASFREEPLHAFLDKMGGHYPDSRIGSIEVTCTTFADLLGGASYLDLLQIDAEGYDLELLKLFDFARIAPPLVRFEHKHLSADEMDETTKLLSRHGYRMLREENDTTAYLPTRARMSDTHARTVYTPASGDR